jgi:NAD(P)-dependent dehydrogenase (short-subunit alcohol dehydrogenase family)
VNIEASFQKICASGVLMATGKSVDGYEIHFAVNHLGHFLLTNLLLDLMKKAPSARIITVASINHTCKLIYISFENVKSIFLIFSTKYNQLG